MGILRALAIVALGVIIWVAERLWILEHKRDRTH